MASLEGLALLVAEYQHRVSTPTASRELCWVFAEDAASEVTEKMCRTRSKLLYLCLPVHPLSPSLSSPPFSLCPPFYTFFCPQLPSSLPFPSFLTLSSPPFPLLFSSPSFLSPPFFHHSALPSLFTPSFPLYSFLTPSSSLLLSFTTLLFPPLSFPSLLLPHSSYLPCLSFSSHPHRKEAAGSVSVVPCGVSLA